MSDTMLCQRTTWRNILGSLLVLVCTKGATCKSEALTTTRAFLPRSLSGGSHPPLPVTAASYHSTSSQGEWDTAINEIHANRDQLIDAEFVAETNLPTDLGHFRLRAYRVARTANEFMGTEPTVIYCTDKPPFGKGGKLAENVPVRVHDQCLTSEVFRSQRYVFLYSVLWWMVDVHKHLSYLINSLILFLTAAIATISSKCH